VRFRLVSPDARSSIAGAFREPVEAESVEELTSRTQGRARLGHAALPPQPPSVIE